jgi:hypothetical protein
MGWLVIHIEGFHFNSTVCRFGIERSAIYLYYYKINSIMIQSFFLVQILENYDRNLEIIIIIEIIIVIIGEISSVSLDPRINIYSPPQMCINMCKIKYL